VVAFLGTRLVEQTTTFVAFLAAVVATDRTESGVAVGQTRSAVGSCDRIQRENWCSRERHLNVPRGRNRGSCRPRSRRYRPHIHTWLWKQQGQSLSKPSGWREQRRVEWCAKRIRIARSVILHLSLFLHLCLIRVLLLLLFPSLNPWSPNRNHTIAIADRHLHLDRTSTSVE
jgi:hypothetical protein